MTWTNDRIDTLKQYWQDGFSASQIAQRLGGITRNAVIGKVHRLGLAGRVNPSRRSVSTRSRSSAQVSHMPARSRRQGPVYRIRYIPAAASPKQHPIMPELGPAPSIPVTVQELTVLTCRWPEGDPKLIGFHFCGRAKTNPAIPYCDHHTAIAFR